MVSGQNHQTTETNPNLKVLHCGGGWPTNIGNAFIDIGIQYLVKKVMPNSEIYFASNATNWIYHTYSKRVDFLNLGGIIESDFVVFGGSMLDPQWFKYHSELFRELAKKGSKIIMCGVGGSTYSAKEINEVRKYLEKLNIFAFISRDRKAFQNYHDLALYSYDGIDCAFFLSDAFTPAPLDLPEYVVFAFDKMAEPKIEHENRAIKIHHAPWSFSSAQIFSKHGLKMFLWSTISHQTHIVKRNDMLSDLPDDYLNLYANCKATYTDRVHACVAALAFGKLARLYEPPEITLFSTKLYGRSERLLLLDRVGLSAIRDNLVSLDKKNLEQEKKREMEFLSAIFTNLSVDKSTR